MAATDILKIQFEFSPKVGTRQLPALTEHYESITVPGLYIGGDLADAPIIKIALNQGFEIVQRIFKKDFLAKVPTRGEGDAAVGVAYPPPRRDAASERYDVVIIGAGPAGIGAAIACQELGLTYVIVEKEKPFNTIQNYPKAKHVFSEPKTIKLLPNVFKFDDEQKEDLVARWESLIDAQGFHMIQPEEVVDVKRDGTDFRVLTKGADGEHGFRARKVFLAIGRRGAVNRLSCKGADLDKIEYVLHEPTRFTGKEVLVVGGGDSAVEAAMSCAEAGAKVTVSYRQDSFARAKAANREKIEKLIAAGSIKAIYNSSPSEIREGSVVLKTQGGTQEIPNEAVLGFIGASLPTEFLTKLGVRMEGEMSAIRALWISTFALITYLVYCVKAHVPLFPFGVFGVDVDSEQVRALNPVGEDGAALHTHPLHSLWYALQHIHIPWWGPHTVDGVVQWGTFTREINGGFLGTVMYSVLVTYFGLKAMRKYPSPAQKKRYKLIIFSQVMLLFAIPELIAPLVSVRPWKWYAIAVPWPLSKWSLIEGANWAPTAHVYFGLELWVWIGLLVSFVGVPLFVRYHGERFCSYLCGCGALAETFGDQWRHLAPRGRTAQQLETFGKVVLGASTIATLFYLSNLYQDVVGLKQVWHVIEPHAQMRAFVDKWYDLIVDFWMACVIGVAAYPYLGNRFWCRFMCPLRAMMELMARVIGRLKIVSNNKCIGCGQCTRYCQMGIDVQRFAQTQKDMANHNSACIQCGICIEVCPMDVLSLERAPKATRRSLPIYGQKSAH